jgi:hypothetical protein
VSISGKREDQKERKDGGKGGTKGLGQQEKREKKKETGTDTKRLAVGFAHRTGPPSLVCGRQGVVFYSLDLFRLTLSSLWFSNMWPSRSAMAFSACSMVAMLTNA